MGKFKRGYLYARAMHSSAYRNVIANEIFSEAEIFMARFLHHDIYCPSRKFVRHFLAVCWTAGLGCGIWSCFLADDSISSLMRSCLNGSVSIVGLLTVTLLPFLLSAFAVLLSGPWLLFGIAFGKGFVFAFVSMASLAGFGCAGWLLRFFLCFSDCLSLPLLYWFWLRCFRSSGTGFGTCIFLTGALLFLIGSIDYCLIVPFLADLIIL